MKCPKCGTGDLAERKARRGNLFWGCTNYPKCDFTSNYKPVAKQCPECKSPYLLEKTLRSGIYLECPNKKKAAEEEVCAEEAGEEGGRRGGSGDGRDVQLLEADWRRTASADRGDAWTGGGEGWGGWPIAEAGSEGVAASVRRTGNCYHGHAET